MTSRPELWRLHNLAREYGQRPSAVLGIEDAWAAYQLDAAVLTLGRWVENRLAERTKDGKPKYRLEELLGVERDARDRPWMDVRSLAPLTARGAGAVASR